MTSSKPVIHVAEWPMAGLTDFLRQLTSEVPVRRIPVACFFVPCSLEDLGNPEEIEILVCSPFFLTGLAELGIHLPNLRWLHSMAVGVEMVKKYVDENKPERPFLLTCAPQVNARPVAEYVTGQIISARRQFIEFYRQQQDAVWDRRSGSTESVSGATLLLLGLGNIGSLVAKLCKGFDMVVHGVTRSPVLRPQASPYVDVQWTLDQLEEALAEADVIVGCVPSTPETAGLLDNDKLRVCQGKKPIFINVGRGDLISEESIIKAVRSEWIGKAVIDVFASEPLPSDSGLWREPNVIVTPHIAMDYNSFTARELCKHIMDNYRRYVKNEPLLDAVDLSTLQ